uniref:Uncharacterized protein n=1 Tax=Spongospora subterranea TaxID=70186 RepID=A0A0H5QUW2_9EUKA|eukprot:CRZ05710.1 hypothetical protein [Spongospora subterranea]
MEMGFCEVWWCEWCCCGGFGCVKAVSVGTAVGFVMTTSFSGVVSSPEKMMRAKRDTGQWGCLGCCLGMSPEKGEEKKKTKGVLVVDSGGRLEIVSVGVSGGFWVGVWR